MKILIADDHPLFREGMQYLLRQLHAEVILLEAGDIAEAAALLAEHRDVDLILLDLNMPGMENFKGYFTLEKKNPNIPIVILSASESPVDIEQALEAGAAGYILKSSTTDIMLGALRMVLDGYIYRPPFNNPNHALLDQLSDSQKEVLRLLCQGRDNRDIARRVGLSESTVKHHVSKILKLSGAASRAQVLLKFSKLNGSA